MSRPSPELVERVKSLALTVRRNPPHAGVISTGERCAVALVLQRLDYSPAGYDSWLEVVARVGDDWLAACIQAQRELEREGHAPFV